MPELKFTNQDATPKEAVVNVDAASVATIMTWYGGYHSGDRYSVRFDGRLLKKDQNGELIGAIS